jgi:hypothetical protein
MLHYIRFFVVTYRKRTLLFSRKWDACHFPLYLQGCQIFLVQHTKKIYQNDHKIYQMAINYTKWQQIRAKGHKIYIFHCKTLQNLPKSGFLVWKYIIWQPWMSASIRTEIFHRINRKFPKYENPISEKTDDMVYMYVTWASANRVTGLGEF